MQAALLAKAKAAAQAQVQHVHGVTGKPMEPPPGIDNRPQGFGWGGALAQAPGAFVPPTERPAQFVPPGEAGKAPTKLAITGKAGGAALAIADASTFVIPKQPYTNDKGVCIPE